MAAAYSSDDEEAVYTRQQYEVQEILNFDKKPPSKLAGTNIELESTLIFNPPFQQPTSPNAQAQDYNTKAIRQQNPSYLTFRVVWNQNIPKIRQLNNWLTVKLRRLNVTESSEHPVHVILKKDTGETNVDADDDSNQFLTTSPMDGRVGRAKVLSYTSKACNRVRVLFIDTGHVADLPVLSLRPIQETLDLDFEPLSFDAVLANVNDYNMSNGYKAIVDYEFRSICQNCESTTSGNQLLVKVFRYNKHLKAFEVYINIIKNGKRICLNDLVQKKYDNCHKLVATGIKKDGISTKPTSTDIAKQTYSDVETHIWKPPTEIGKTMRIYQITNIVSPTHFYFVPISASASNIGNNPRLLPSWFETMQTFYDDEDFRDAFKKRTAGVFRGRCYIWKFCNLWERVRVTNANPKGPTCTVNLVDIGFYLSAPKNELYEIDTLFVGESVIALQGKLQHIEPIGEYAKPYFDPDDEEEDDEKVSKIWPEEAVQYMKKLAYGKFFYGIFVQDSQFPVFRNLTKEQSDQRRQFLIQKKKAALEKHLKRLKIFSKSKRTANEVESEVSHVKFGMVFVEITQKSRVSLNAELCLANFASAFGPAAGSTFQLVKNAVSLPKFDYNEMRTDSLKYERDEFVDPGQNPEFLNDFKPFEVETEELLSLPDITNRADFLDWVGHNPPLKEFSNRVPTIIRFQLALCKLTCVLSPSCMYIQLLAKRKEFTMMTKNLGTQMETREHIPPKELNVGLMANVLTSNSKDKDIEPTWHRAVVKQILGALGLVKVILLDFGTEYTAEDNKLYPMPTYFASIPSFCFRVHLDLPNLAPKNKVTWSQQATTIFKRYIDSWTHQKPVYFFWKRHSSKVIRLDALNQELFFDIGTTTWDKIPLEKKSGYSTTEVPNKMQLQGPTTSTSNPEGSQLDENPSITRFPNADELVQFYRRKQTTSLRNKSPSPERGLSGSPPAPYGDTPAIISPNYEFEAPFTYKNLEKCPPMGNHFISVGIDFGYEIFTPTEGNYKFGSGFDALADGGHVIPLN